MAVLNVYFEQMRPSVKPELIEETEVQGKGYDWNYVVKKAMEHEVGRPDAHFIKGEWVICFEFYERGSGGMGVDWLSAVLYVGVRAIKEFAALDKENEEFYLKAAIKFVHEFKRWVGFTYSDESLDIKP